MIFVSYSRSDISVTLALVESLSAVGVECWLDESNIPVGQAFVERLGNALRESEGFLLVDTPASRSSYWASREFLTSSRYRRSGRHQTSLRLYSAECKHSKATNWDASLPLDQHAHEHVAKLLSIRRITQGVPNHEVEYKNVLIQGNAGLGQPNNWMGRQEDLRLLDQWWFGPNAGLWLGGLAGTGKSGLLQTWVAALSCLGYDQAVLTNVLYIGGREVVEVSDAKQALSNWVAQATSPWRLLLLDGHDEAVSTTDVEEVLREAFRLGVRAIVTSRGTLPQSLGQHFTNLSLSNMTRRDSVAILSQFGVTESESERVAEELGDNPLALLIFSQSMASRNQTAAEALMDLRRIQKNDSTVDVGSSRMIRAAISSSVLRLTTDARWLLNILCQSEEGCVTPSMAWPSILELTSAGLIQVDHIDKPTQVSVHPMVRRFVNEECQGNDMG